MEVYLCFYYCKSRVGVAVLNQSTAELCEMYLGFAHIDFLKEALSIYGPTQIITSTSVSQSIKAFLENSNTQFIPNTNFNYEKAKTQVIKHCFQNDYFKAKSAVNFNQTEMITALGVMIECLEKTNGLPEIASVKQVSMGTLVCDSLTLNSLSIFKENSHPSKINNLGRSKEGISFFGLFDNTCSPQGKKMLRDWFLRPLCNLEAIHSRQDAVEYFVQHQSTKELMAELKNVSDLRTVLKHFCEFKNTKNDWSKLVTTLETLLNVFSFLKSFEVPRILGVFHRVSVSELEELFWNLKTCLDLSESESVRINEGISEKLDYLRKTHSQLDGFLAELSEKETQKLPNHKFSKLSIVHFSQIGYLVQVRYPSTSKLESIDLKDFEEVNYDFQFNTEDSLYFKNPTTLKLDSKFSDLKSLISDMENEIKRNLENQVIEAYDSLVYSSDCLALLDCILSLSVSADSYQLTRPQMSQNSGIKVVNARHLLVELCVDHLVPNDCALDSEHRVAVITGPNYSGKSIYMKTVASLVYLAQIGSFVPAEEASLGIVDQIFSRVNYADNYSEGNFEEEISQVSILLNNASYKSLVLVDEFGKGTNSVEGMSLMGALINYLNKETSPLCLLTTHFQELITHKIVPETTAVKFYTMEMALRQEPIFLYKLIKGKPIGSFGFNCAKWAGIGEEILRRAEEVRESLRNPQNQLRPLATTKRSQYNQVMKLLSSFQENDDPYLFLQKIYALMN